MAGHHAARRQIAEEAARLLQARDDLAWSQAMMQAAHSLFPSGFPERFLPGRDDVRRAVVQMPRTKPEVAWPERFAEYVTLLKPLADVRQDPATHPEGDALYHSLQVFVLAEEALPYDEEFQTASLLHDIGLAIDRKQPVEAALEALEGLVTPRTLWLVEHVPTAHAKKAGLLGARGRRRLDEHADREELMQLAECDLRGRKRGAEVPEAEEAVERLARLCELDDDLELAG
ncbi:MAG: hypothetical protein AAGA92_15860 [Planctomycetota bacterium]